MKAPSAGFRIKHRNGFHSIYEAAEAGATPVRPWVVLDDQDGGKTVWNGKTAMGARTAHYRLAVARLTGRPVSYAQARRAGNA